MKLAKCEIKNFRRFVDISVNLDSNLLAFIGPNEAGKTSFFQALLEFEKSGTIPDSNISRKTDLKSKDIIESMYHDKKNAYNKLRLILAKNIGSVEIVDDVPEMSIKAVLEKK